MRIPSGSIKKRFTLPVNISASDGYTPKSHCWWHDGPCVRRAAVIINPATSVCCSYYARFAAFLHQHSLDVLTYDY
jgi:predicted alpha/beta hydrolase